jgi:hypothetical protein
MDWNAAIEKNREALKRVLTMLVAMAGMGARGQLTFFPQDSALSQGLAPAEKGKPSPTLPRRLHRAILALLRPAEAAARRLIIVAARGLGGRTPQARLCKPNTASPQARKTGMTPTILRNGVGTGIVMPPHLQAGLSRPEPRKLALSLFDPLPRWGGHHRPLTRSVPRISVPGYSVPFPIPAPPSPDDPIDAQRLVLRLQALGRVLDNLPAEARRFARWRSRDAAGAQNEKSRDAAGAQNKKPHGSRPFRRVWPLRPGRPPGWRRNPIHEVHEILNVAHGLAVWALEDTS